MHIPVLLNEVLSYLNAEKGSRFIDATAGNGGHLTAILEKNRQAKALGIDLDSENVGRLQSLMEAEKLADRCIIRHGNYRNISEIADSEKFRPVSGILLDLGFSSNQLDDLTRGFSFQTSGPLDMRYDKSAALTAAEVVNRYPETKLETIIKQYGEEKFSRQIARKIADQRKLSVLTTTDEVFRLIKEALPKPVRFKAADSARRVFQAIRIEVNGELDSLKAVLPRALDLLESGGRLVIISFHSLEDRIVKQFFAEESKDCVCPPEFPTCVCSKSSKIKILTQKPVVAQPSEIEQNPRARAAKLRAVEKI